MSEEPKIPPKLRQKEKELHETPAGRDYDHSQQETDTEEETFRPSTSMLVIRGFVALGKELSRKMS